MKEIKQGDVRDFRNFVAAVIDEGRARTIGRQIRSQKKDGSRLLLGFGRPAQRNALPAANETIGLNSLDRLQDRGVRERRTQAIDPNAIGRPIDR